MARKKLLLEFPQTAVSKPITYRLIKDYDLLVNIFRARVTPEEKGELGIEIEGDENKIKEGLDYLEKEGIKITPLEKQIEHNRETCIDCGACVSLCRLKAIEVNHKTYEIQFNKEKCIACELCVDACPVNAIKVNF